MTDFQDRLKLTLDHHSVSKVSERTNISKSQLYRLCEPGRDTTRGNIEAISRATGVSILWLVSGEGPMYLDGTPPPATDLPKPQKSEQKPAANDQYVQIPLLDVRVSASNGAVVEHEQVVDALAFKRDWVSNILGAAREDLYLINVQGESMTPTLHPGDVILVDRRSANNVTTDGVYVLRMGESLLVKRIQRLPGQTLRITSDNPAYSPFEIKMEDAANDDMAIVGRVVWSGRRM